MDIFAHALWTNAITRATNKKLQVRKQRLLSLFWTTLWGIFPDLFAFTIPFVLGIFSLVSGDGFAFGRPSTASGLAPILYQYSHSLVIWLGVFIITWIISKRPRWELFGWALHIIIDVPTHAANFYATPLLFPLSDWKFLYGISWGTRWFMITNYSLLLVTWVGIAWHSWRRSKKESLITDQQVR